MQLEGLPYNKEWLYEKYVDEGLSAGEIARSIGCTNSRVYYALGKYNIPRRKQIKYQEIHDMNWLKKMYTDERLTVQEIAALVGCSVTIVREALRSFNISPRRAIPELQDKNLLFELYINRNKSANTISNIFGCSKKSVLSALKKHGIQVKGPSERLKTKEKKTQTTESRKFEELWDCDWLFEKYIHEGLSSCDIAKLLGCNHTSVCRAMRRFEIPCSYEKRHSEKWFNGVQRLRKRVEVRCDYCDNVLSRTPSQINEHNFCSNECMGKWIKRTGAVRGKNHPQYGTHRSEETKRKISAVRKRAKMPTHHTKPEMIFYGFCKKDTLPFKYTGDGSFWIGKMPAINPDFIHLTEKIVVEIFSYWHDPLRRHSKIRYSYTYEGRKKILKERGWKLIVFWQEDLERDDAEAFVLATLKREGAI